MKMVKIRLFGALSKKLLFALAVGAGPTLGAHADTPPEGVELVDLTGAGKGSVSSMYTSGWTDNSSDATAFDDNFDNRSIYNSQTCDWRWTFNEPTVVTAYKFYAPESNYHLYGTRMPKTWRFEGKNAADADWTTLDTRSNEANTWSRKEGRYFEFDNYAAYDSYRLISTATIEGGSGYTQIAEIEMFCTILPGMPSVANAEMTRTENGYTVSGTVKWADAECGAIAIDSDGNATYFSAGNTTKDSHFETSVTGIGLTTNKTYEMFAYARNNIGAVSNSVGVIYNGALTLVKVSDAAEYMAVPGTVTVSRASADAYPLTVNYRFATSHPPAAEGTTWIAPGPVTIAAGERSAVLTLVPMTDAAVDEDVTITLADADGNYGGFSPNTVDLSIANVAFPSAYNVWCAASNGSASVAANWSKGRVPSADDAVLFDGYFSNASCTWDSDETDGPSATVASWTQRNGYSGTIELRTVFPEKGDFTCLTVTGALTIDAGTLTHPQSRTMGENHDNAWDWTADLIANETYRIRIAAGSLSVGENGAIDVRTKGYYASHDASRCMGSHGGRFAENSAAVYGDPKEPIHIGLPQRTANNYYNGKGGGAIYLTVSGSAVVNGAICADSGNTGYGSGAAGSVYLAADTVSGTGSVTARGSGSGEGNFKGCGGRVAIITRTPVERSTFSAISAECEWKNAQSRNATYYGGPGTVYFKDSTMTNGRLVIAAKSDISAIDTTIVRQCYVGTDGDWTFDSVEFAPRSYLILPMGATLTLPGGLATVSGTGAGVNVGGLIFCGGVLSAGDFTGQTVANHWILTGWSNLVINADVTVSEDAAIGVPPVQVIRDSGSEPPMTLSSSVTVNGDLTVAADGRLAAFSSGCRKSNQWVSQGVFGHAAHGGRVMAAMSQDITCKSAYDSVFAPSLPGCGIPWPDGQGVGNSGGAMKVLVTGAFTMNGVANASGESEAYNQGGNCGGGAGGSIDITAGSIAGDGSIRADGGCYGWMGGPGGRIAVKLTDARADFSQFTGVIRATGRARGSKSGAQGSAGTVYLKTGSEGEKAGTLKIACPKYESADDWNAKTSTTEIVSLGYGGDAVSDMKKVKLVVAEWGRAAVNADVQFASLTLSDGNSFVDLEGHTLTVTSAEVDGERIPIGVYEVPAQGTLDSFPVIYNTAATAGQLIVNGGGFTMVVR